MANPAQLLGRMASAFFGPREPDLPAAMGRTAEANRQLGRLMTYGDIPVDAVLGPMYDVAYGGMTPGQAGEAAGRRVASGLMEGQYEPNPNVPFGVRLLADSASPGGMVADTPGLAARYLPNLRDTRGFQRYLGAAPTPSAAPQGIVGMAVRPTERSVNMARPSLGSEFPGIGSSEFAQAMMDYADAGVAQGLERWYDNSAIYEHFRQHLPDDEAAAMAQLYLRTGGPFSGNTSVAEQIQRQSAFLEGVMQGRDPRRVQVPMAQQRNTAAQMVMGDESPFGSGAFKTSGYTENLAGNLQPYTIDIHALRSTMLGLPRGAGAMDSVAGRQAILDRFGLTGNQVQIKGDTLQNLQDMGYPMDLIEERTTRSGSTQYFTRFTPEVAAAMNPRAFSSALYQGRISGGRYGALEERLKEVADLYNAERGTDLQPAEFQAAVWGGAGEDTGVQDVRRFSELVFEAFDARAADLGIPPDDLWDQWLQGNITLRSVMAPTGGGGAAELGRTLSDMQGGSGESGGR